MWRRLVAPVGVAGHGASAAEPRGMELHDRWMRTTEVAEELGVDPETVRRLIRARRLRATVLLASGRPTFRILRSDFERFRAAYTRDSVVDDWE